MIEIFNGSVYDFGSASSIWAIINYESKRNGNDMLYRFNYSIKVSNRSGALSSSTYYSNTLQTKFYLDSNNVYTKSTKSSSSGWSFEYTTDWFTVEDKTSGRTPFKFTIKDTQNSSWCNYTSGEYSLEISPASSEITSLSNFNIGQPFLLSITKYNEDFYDKLVIKLNDTTIKTIDNVLNGATIDFTTDELNAIYSLTANSQYGEFTFELSSYEDSEFSVQIGETNTTIVKGYIIASNPLINDKSAIDTNSATNTLTGANTTIIKGYSNVLVSVSASGQNQATIKTITVNGVEASLNDNVYSVLFENASINTFNIIVVDSREFQTPSSITLEMIDYIPLTLNVDVVRNQATDNKVKINYSGNYFNDTFGKLDNTLKVQYRFKEKNEEFSDDDVWVDMTPNIEENTYSQKNLLVSDIDYHSIYNFQFRAVDLLAETPTISKKISKGEPLFTILPNEVSSYTDFMALKNAEISGNLITGKEISEDITNAFRTTIFGDKSADYVIKTMEATGEVATYMPEKSYGIAFTGHNKNGFLILSLDGNAWVGGGDYDKIEWYEELAYINNIFTETSFGENSGYIKFGNGLMITMQTQTEKVAMTSSGAGWYNGTFSTIEFPQEFADVPYPVATVVGDTIATISRIESITTTQIEGLRLSRGNSSTAEITLKIITFGRWK